MEEEEGKSPTMMMMMLLPEIQNYLFGHMGVSQDAARQAGRLLDICTYCATTTRYGQELSRYYLNFILCASQQSDSTNLLVHLDV